ncbi:MAG: rhodanese-like domain-containing protein [Bacilli bacterium]|nr:rhodanese-like domain-containing protein [Bacilli bacterium]
MKKLLLISAILLLFTACNNKDATDNLLKMGKISCSDIDIIKTYDDYMIIDVRTPDEYAEGHLDNAINIEYQDIVEKLEENYISKDTPIIVYCISGGRSGKAFESLKQAGYTHIYDLGAMSNCSKGD